MEEPRRRENWQDLVTAEQIEKYNAIQLKTMETKKLSRTDGAFLKKLDRKTRVCNSCGRTVEEAKGWGVFDFVNPDGTRIPCGSLFVSPNTLSHSTLLKTTNSKRYKF